MKWNHFICPGRQSITNSIVSFQEKAAFTKQASCLFPLPPLSLFALMPSFLSVCYLSKSSQDCRPGFWVTTTESLIGVYSIQWMIQTWWKKASFDEIVPVSVNSESANNDGVSWGNTGVQRVSWFWKWIATQRASPVSFLLLGWGPELLALLIL